MSAADLAAVVVTIAALVALVVLLFAAQALLRALREARAAVDAVQAEAAPAAVQLHDAAARAAVGLERADQILAHAEGITTSLDTTSQLAYKIVTNPAIKVMAAASGTRRAAHRLRRRP